MVAKYAHQNGDHIQAAMDKLEARYRSNVPTGTPDYTEITPAA